MASGAASALMVQLLGCGLVAGGSDAISGVPEHGILLGEKLKLPREAARCYPPVRDNSNFFGRGHRRDLEQRPLRAGACACCSLTLRSLTERICFADRTRLF